MFVFKNHVLPSHYVVIFVDMSDKWWLLDDVSGFGSGQVIGMAQVMII